MGDWGKEEVGDWGWWTEILRNRKWGLRNRNRKIQEAEVEGWGIVNGRLWQRKWGEEEEGVGEEGRGSGILRQRKWEEEEEEVGEGLGNHYTGESILSIEH
jgi:hypothetical protein